MNGRKIILACAFLLLLSPLAGCQIVIPGPLPKDAGPEVQRDAGYALLMSVLEDESSVAGLLAIKTVSKETEALINMIATKSDQAAKKLKALAKTPPPIQFKNSGLPVIEIESRSWIRNQTSVALLGTSGPRMEYALLLSQLSATNYIAALSAALVENDPSEERKTELRLIQRQFSDLYTALLNRLMQMKPEDSAKPKEST